VNLERLYNVREGLSRSDDQLPRRFVEEAVPLYAFERDPATGVMRQSREPVGHARLYDFEAMLDRYYRLRGWSEDGIPLPETLRRLGLEESMEEGTSGHWPAEGEVNRED
jgi:aldehyde:ferredoxin oxidoreductase